MTDRPLGAAVLGAGWVAGEHIKGYTVDPNVELRAVGEVWKDTKRLEHDVARLSKAAKGLDGRRIRKGIFAAMASDIETAKDPGKLTVAQIEAAFQRALKTQEEVTQ